MIRRWDCYIVSEISALAFLWALGLSGNLLIAWTLITKKLLKHLSNRLVLNLNVSSFIFNLTVCPFTAYSLFHDSSDSLETSEQFWCKLVGFFAGLTYVICTSTIAFIAIDRYIAIVKPMKFAHLVTKSRSSAAVAVIWVNGILLALFPLFFTSVEYKYVEAKRSCILYRIQSFTYATIYLLFAFLIPLLIILYCYLSIFRPIYNTKDSTSSSRIWFYKYVNKSFVTVFTVVGSFLITTIPDSSIVFHKSFGSVNNSDNIFMLIRFSYWMNHLGYCSYPILYGLMNRMVRKEIFKTLRSSGNKDRAVIKSRSSSNYKRRVSMPVFSVSHYNTSENKSAFENSDYWRKHRDLLIEMSSGNTKGPSSHSIINRRISEPTSYENCKKLLKKRRLMSTNQSRIADIERKCRNLRPHPTIIITPPK